MMNEKTAHALNMLYPPSEQLKIGTLFYDGSCPLCAREIKSMKRTQGTALRLIDVHTLETISTEAQHELLKRLHLLQIDGTWLTGLDANVAAWSDTYLGRIFKILRLPLLRALSDRVYLAWAESRFRKRYCAATNKEGCM